MKIKRFKKRKAFLMLFGHLAALGTSHTLAGPLGGQVVSGAGQVRTSGTTTTIQQTTPTLSLTWDKFNVTAQETVNFVQPSASAVAVNRIFDVNGSQIMGHINANGQVFLINPNGVLFGKDAVVNVGSLVASTLDIHDANVNGSARTFSGGGSGQLVNLGTINAAQGGYVALLGNQVSNQGVITAQLGTVVMGAGSAVTLNFNGNSLVSLQVDQSVLNSLVENGGMISADGGRVALSAGARDSLLASVVNNTGHIEARTLQNQNGVITLMGGMKAGTVNVAGTLDASAPTAGNGGFIETSAAHVKVANDTVVDTRAHAGQVGTWLIDPQDYTVAATGGDISGATLSANLGTTSVSLQSSNGNATGSGNLNINDAVAWRANTALTLTASNNVNVNANIEASGNSAGLVINPNTSVGADAASGTGVFKLGSGASITLSGEASSLAIAGTPYVVIHRLGEAGSTTGTDLQGMQAGLSGHYALGNDIDASATATWDNHAGFNPVGSAAPFTGVLDGLGHTISQLTINRPAATNVGLFGSAAGFAEIRHVGLVGGSVVGAAGTGSLLGTAVSATISDSYNTGSVTGAAGTGGLVGVITTGGISNSYNTGSVTGAAGTGGLVGVFTTGNVSASYTTGDVTGAAGTGGLAGVMTTGNVSDTYTTGNVAGAAGTGGLVGGITTGFIRNSFATGTVQGAAGTDGLAGTSAANSIVNSYAVSTGGVIDFSSWNYSNVWTLSASGMPVLNALMKTVIITTLNDSKTYDGTAYIGNRGASYAGADTSYLTGTLVYGGLSQGAVNVGSYAITASGVTSSNAQYKVVYVNGNLTIARLPTVAWVGGTTGNWFDPSNWAGGAVPNLANVANVTIPAGVNVSFNNSLALPAQAGTVHVDSIASGGALNMLAGTLTVATLMTSDVLNQSGGLVNGAGDIRVNSLNQTGGVIANAGHLVVSQSFVQNTTGVIAVGGNVSITQAAGNLEINNLSGHDIDLSAIHGGAYLGNVSALGALNILADGDITQTLSGSLVVGGDSAINSRTGDITLANASNDQDGVVVLHGRNITLTDISGPTVVLDATGNTTLNSGGNIAVSGSTQDLNINTYNGGGTSFGATTISGNLAVNSAGSVTQINTVTVIGTASITTPAQNLTSILADKALADAAAAKVIADAAAAKAIADAAIAAEAKAIADAAAAKVIADAAAAKAIADAAIAAEAKAIADAAAAKVIADAAAAKVITDAAAAKVIADAEAAKAIADAASAKVIADAAIAAEVKAIAAANIDPNTTDQKSISNAVVLQFMLDETAANNEAAAAAEKIVKVASFAKQNADATAAQVVIEAELTKAFADSAALRVIADARTAKVVVDAASSQSIADASAAIARSRDTVGARAITRKSAALEVALVQSAERVIADAKRTAQRTAQVAAFNVVFSAAAAKVVADAVATKVVADALALAPVSKGKTDKLAMDAIAAKVTMDVANAKIMANAKDAKRIVDDADIKVIADASAAAQVVVIAAADAKLLTQALMDYLMAKNAALH